MKVSKDKVVQFHYILTEQNGIQLDSSVGKDPLEYIHGNNMIIPGLEARLEGTEAGDKFTVTVPAKDAYGEYDDFNRLPLMVVSDKDTANMVCEELYKSDNQFMSLVKKVFDYVPYEEIGWSWVEVEYFSLV